LKKLIFARGSAYKAVQILIGPTDGLADARQLLADHGGNDTVGAHCGARDQHALVFRGGMADARGVFSEGVAAQD
jgi:hypothetical protein